jgi:DNA-binding NarL/FixJ family response regulator
MCSATISIALVEDHPMFRYALEAAISADQQLRLVGSHATGEAALSHLREEAADVTLVDLGLPDIDGAALIRLIRRAAPDTRIVVLSGTVTAESVHSSLAAGAMGYLGKEVEAADVTAAIADVTSGRTVLSRSAQEQAAEILRSTESDHSHVLTTRERAVLASAAKGLSSLAIAKELNVSRSTVKSHLSAAYRKLGAGDRASAVLTASRRGLI